MAGSRHWKIGTDELVKQKESVEGCPLFLFLKHKALVTAFGRLYKRDILIWNR